MTSTFATILAELADPGAQVDSIRHDHSPYHLATIADTYSPDGDDSPGARFLARVARDVADRFDSTEDDAADELAGIVRELTDGDDAHMIADGAVPIYTHERWAVFTDLGAYNEDVSELGEVDGSDLTAAAGVALYIIADRLVRALAEELSEALDEDDEDDEDEDDEEQDTRPDGSVVYYTRDSASGTYVAVTANGVQIGPGRFETIGDARAYLASLDDLTADA